MDGNLFAVKTEKEAAVGELSAVIGALDLTRDESWSAHKRLRHDSQGAAPMACLLFQIVFALGAILGTCGAAWLGRMFLTPSQAAGQLVPDSVALVVFLLATRLR